MLAEGATGVAAKELGARHVLNVELDSDLGQHLHDHLLGLLA